MIFGGPFPWPKEIGDDLIFFVPAWRVAAQPEKAGALYSLGEGGIPLKEFGIGIRSFLERYASGLRYPRLLLIILGVFILDVAVPDLIPFADEVLLGLIALVLSRLKNREGKSDRSLNNTRRER